MKYQKQFVLEFPDNTLAKPPKTEDSAALDSEQVWFEAANQEDTLEQHLLDGMSSALSLEGFDVDHNVGQFGHAAYRNQVRY